MYDSLKYECYSQSLLPIYEDKVLFLLIKNGTRDHCITCDPKLMRLLVEKFNYSVWHTFMNGEKIKLFF